METWSALARKATGPPLAFRNRLFWTGPGWAPSLLLFGAPFIGLPRTGTPPPCPPAHRIHLEGLLEMADVMQQLADVIDRSLFMLDLLTSAIVSCTCASRNGGKSRKCRPLCNYSDPGGRRNCLDRVSHFSRVHSQYRYMHA